MSDGFKSEAEGYAASLRLQAQWHDNSSGESLALDTDEIRGAADFIDRQQAEIEALKHDIERHLAIVTAELSYDSKCLHG